MKDWRAAGDKVRRRTVAEILESLAVEAPFEFLPTSAASDSPSFLDANWELLSEDYETVLSYPGRDANFVTDALICVTKFWHVLGRAHSSFEQGALTWTVVDAYHACLMGARSILALNGILSYNLRGRSVLLDYRPEFGSPDDRRAFSKLYADIDDPVRILLPVSRQLEQKDTWNILKRLCALATASDPNKAQLMRISGLSDQPLSQPRNTVFYDSVAWLWRTDFRAEGDGLEFNCVVRSFDDNVDNTLSALEEIFDLSKIVMGELGARIGLDPLKLADIASRQPSEILRAA